VRRKPEAAEFPAMNCLHADLSRACARKGRYERLTISLLQ
jgi:hypothetical protein